ncbi:hypothetical protein AHIS1636_26510 [Arthrobacter mangrovi]|uniref:Uncharacterized protein n=1 Tax=Arthrobacter mangrovi TaxID=2966350 RepID=A0ABQ5MW63_9MICC|nr:hypothetical protein AHIS1636_26510 [Arthrobacter mangrovi]
MSFRVRFPPAAHMPLKAIPCGHVKNMSEGRRAVPQGPDGKRRDWGRAAKVIWIMESGTLDPAAAGTQT